MIFDMLLDVKQVIFLYKAVLWFTNKAAAHHQARSRHDWRSV